MYAGDYRRIAWERDDRFQTILNRVLAIVYVPYALFCALCLMATETTLTQTSPLVIAGGYIFGYCGLFTALTAHLCLFIGTKLHRDGKRIGGYVVRFLPVIIMVMAFAICVGMEFLAGI